MGGLGRCRIRRGAAAVAAVVAAGTGVVVVGPTPSAAVSPGLNGRIAFGDGGCTHTVETDGTGLATIGACPSRNGEAIWSPDGTRLAVLVDQDVAGGSIVLYDADGTGPTTIIDESVHELNGWSRDGDLLAFTATRQSDGTFTDAGLKLIGLNGTITAIPGTDDVYDAALSADGSRIAAFAQPDELAETLVTFALDGSDRRNVLDLGSGTAAPSGIDWSPNGTQLVFGAVANACSGRITVVNADGTGQRDLPVSATCNEYDPAWSPDGTKLVFAAGEAGEPSGLYVMDAADGSNRRLVHAVSGESVGSPSWQSVHTPNSFTIDPSAGDVGSVIAVDGGCEFGGDAVALYRASDGALADAEVQLGNPGGSDERGIGCWVTTLTVSATLRTATGEDVPTTNGAYEVRLFRSIGSSFKPPDHPDAGGMPAPDAVLPFTVEASATTTTSVVPTRPVLDLVEQLVTTLEEVLPGGTVGVGGGGFAPGSIVTLTLFSEPVELTRLTVGGDGTFWTTVTIPEATAAGVHRIVATGVGPTGAARSIEITINVSSALASGAVPVRTSLPSTGGTASVLTLAAAALVVGSALRGIARRA